MIEANDISTDLLPLSPDQADRLRKFAKAHGVSEVAVVERALDILFGLTALIAEGTERRGWSATSADAFARVWNNDDDAVYDDWRDLYGVSAG